MCPTFKGSHVGSSKTEKYSKCSHLCLLFLLKLNSWNNYLITKTVTDCHLTQQLIVSAVDLIVRLVQCYTGRGERQCKIQTLIHTWVPSSDCITIHISFSLCVCFCLCLSPFPVLCFKAEACVTHSTWHMKPLSCLEPGVRERGRKKGGERRVDVGVYEWNEGVQPSPFLFV